MMMTGNRGCNYVDDFKMIMNGKWPADGRTDRIFWHGWWDGTG